MLSLVRLLVKVLFSTGTCWFLKKYEMYKFCSPIKAEWTIFPLMPSRCWEGRGMAGQKIIPNLVESTCLILSSLVRGWRKAWGQQAFRRKIACSCGRLGWEGQDIIDVCGADVKQPSCPTTHWAVTSWLCLCNLWGWNSIQFLWGRLFWGKPLQGFCHSPTTVVLRFKLKTDVLDLALACGDWLGRKMNQDVDERASDRSDPEELKQKVVAAFEKGRGWRWYGVTGNLSCERSRSPRDAKRSREAWSQRNWSQQRMAASYEVRQRWGVQFWQSGAFNGPLQLGWGCPKNPCAPGPRIYPWISLKVSVVSRKDEKEMWNNLVEICVAYFRIWPLVWSPRRKLAMTMTEQLTNQTPQVTFHQK